MVIDIVRLIFMLCVVFVSCGRLWCMSVFFVRIENVVLDFVRVLMMLGMSW